MRFIGYIKKISYFKKKLIMLKFNTIHTFLPVPVVLPVLPPTMPVIFYAPGQKYMKKGLLGATCFESAMKWIALSTISSFNV